MADVDEIQPVPASTPDTGDELDSNQDDNQIMVRSSLRLCSLIDVAHWLTDG